MKRKGVEIIDLNVKELIKDLNKALAAEGLAAYRYKYLSKVASGLNSIHIVEEFEKMIRDSLETEREAIVFYNNLYNKTQHADPVTADLVIKILADEVEDEDKLLRLLSK